MCPIPRPRRNTIRRLWSWPGALLLALLAATARGFPPPTAVAAANAPWQGHVTILHADAGSMELLFTATPPHPWDGSPPPPEALSQTVLLGLPTLAGLRLELLDATIMPLPSPATQPQSGAFAPPPPLNLWPDVAAVMTQPPVAGRETGLPSSSGEPVALLEQGYLGEQAVAALAFAPLQRAGDGSGQLHLYRRLRVALRWDGVEAAAGPRPTRPTYANLWQATLFNDPTPVAQAPGAIPVPPARTVAAASSWPTLKIFVDQTGIYRLTYDDLVQAGLDPATLDPRHLQLWHRGVQQAILVDGEADGRLDAGDALLFFGQGIDLNGPDGLYTTENVYWLQVGTEPGTRMATRDGTPNVSPPLAQAFPDHRHVEVDTAYWQTMPPDLGTDRWFWGTRLSPNSAGMPAAQDYVFDLALPAATPEVATLRVRLKGYTAGAHRTRLSLNGTFIDEQIWQGQADFDHVVTIDHSLLQVGDNVLTVEALDSGAEPDQLLVNWLEVDYLAGYLVQDDELAFSLPGPGSWQVVIPGFTQPAITVLDVSRPDGPVRIVGGEILASGEGYRLHLTDTASIMPRYWAATPARYRRPLRIQADRPSQWRSPTHGADYVVITHANFYTSALRLAEHRQDQGLRAAVVDVADLYDEFNHGIFNPRAIRDFLAYVYRYWQPPAPTYVLLLGDAYQDYRDILGFGQVNYVPSQVIATRDFGETSSDNWFVTVHGDDPLPDLLIGRLPARTAQEAEAMVSKVIDYDRYPPEPAWNRQVLLVADDDDPLFNAISQDLRQRLPPDYQAQLLDVADFPPGDPTAAILAAINQGRLLVNYAGHGEYYRWGLWQGGTILELADLAALDNRTRLPFVTVANCLNGFFSGPNPSLAEGLLGHGQGGALAVWAPTGLGQPAGHRVLLDALYDAFFRDSLLSLGAATAAARITAYSRSPAWRNLLDTYALLGDPATALGAPPNPPRLIAVEPPHGAQEVPIDAPIVLTFSKRMDPATVQVTGVDNAIAIWNATDTQLTLVHSPLTHGRTYQPQVFGQDSVGDPLVAGEIPTPWHFQVSSDDIPPQMAVTVEAGTAPTQPAIRLRFSEPVRPESVAIQMTPPLHTPPGEEEVSLPLRWLKDGQEAWLAQVSWTPGTIYTLRVERVRDLAGNPLAAPVAVQFHVADLHQVYLPQIQQP